MINRLCFRILALASAAMIASCAGSRFARDGEKLYAGAEVVVVDPGGTVDKKAIRKTLRETIAIKPNRSFLGFYPKLWFYSLAPDSARKGFRTWLRKKAGEPPVYVKDVHPEATARAMDARLFNIGIFNGSTSYSITGGMNAAGVLYSCTVHPPFRIRTLAYLPAGDSLSAAIAALAPTSIIKAGEPYDLSKLKLERERIDSVLKEQGYFYFNAGYLLFDADTSRASRTVNLRLSLKNDISAEARLAYRIGRIAIDPAYTLARDSLTAPADTTVVDSILFIGSSLIKPAIIARSCAFRRNRLYSNRQHKRTLNRMMSMGNFKYAAIRYSGRDSAGNGILDVKILLTPLDQRSLRTELTMVSKSNDFVGPKLDLNYSDRNVFGGAELLHLSMSGSAETQFVGKNKNLFSYELNPQADVTVPRFMVPFISKTPRGAYVPKTIFSSGYSFVRRINFFDSRSLLFSYGFSWRTNRQTMHELNPVTINYLSLSNRSQEFIELIDTNSYLRRSYEEQFIAASRYSCTYSEQVATKQKNQFYFNGTAESAGNALSLGYRLFAGQTPSAAHPLTVAGSAYSQFVRITFDARNVTNYSTSRKLAIRLYAGAAKAYGNSATLPYSKQFFCGGPTGIRAFHINSVGPGTAKPQENAAFLATGGDLKLEANAEYRFPLIGFLKGAAFIDAGNTWHLKQAEGVDSLSLFALNRFYKEYALGSGAGLRLDLSFFILRFDLGVPLRKPWLPEPQRWVTGSIDFGKSSWRKENLVWNIAIGYPF